MTPGLKTALISTGLFLMCITIYAFASYGAQSSGFGKMILIAGFILFWYGGFFVATTQIIYDKGHHIMVAFLIGFGFIAVFPFICWLLLGSASGFSKVDLFGDLGVTLLFGVSCPVALLLTATIPNIKKAKREKLVQERGQPGGPDFSILDTNE